MTGWIYVRRFFDWGRVAHGFARLGRQAANNRFRWRLHGQHKSSPCQDEGGNAKH